MLQAMIEDTSVWQAGDMASGMPFLANASSHQPNLVLTTGTVLPKLLSKSSVSHNSQTLSQKQSASCLCDQLIHSLCRPSNTAAFCPVGVTGNGY